MSFLEKLKKRWNVGSVWQVIAIFTVFALTGFTVVYLKRFFKPMAENLWWFDLVYYIAILPVYQLFLLLYGFLFGQFSFFIQKERKLIKWFSNLFKKK